MWLIFLSKVKIGNQEVEITFSTPLDYNLVRGRDKHLFNNESSVWQSGSTARSQGLVHVLNNMLDDLPEVHCQIVCMVWLAKFLMETSKTLSICCRGKYCSSNYFLDRMVPYRQAPDQGRTVLCLIGFSVIDCRDLCHWQIGRADFVEPRGLLSTPDLAHMAGG